MIEIFMDALIDSAKMIPLLFLVYMGISLIENRYGNEIAAKVKSAGKAGPGLGAIFGIIPQCGFSVISTALYTKRCVSIGTLMAVYLSTSDEAIPVILSHPEKASVIFPLLGVKAIIAIISGYTIDFILNKTGQQDVKSEMCAAADESELQGTLNNMIMLDVDTQGKGCCGHDCYTQAKPSLKEILTHPLIHTGKVFLYLFAATLVINMIIFRMGEDTLHKVFLGNSILQPFVVALIGLIPNCASSVAVTEVFLRGGISFGATIAGLSASSGLGLLILLKENPDKMETIKIIGLLFGISVAFGTLIQLFYG